MPILLLICNAMLVAGLLAYVLDDGGHPPIKLPSKR
jgi:hypothetical protein